MSRSPFPLSPDKPLGGRYRIVQQLGVGGFGRTFLAADLHLPGYPQCVIKHLKPQVKSEDTLLMARRCFNTEAQVLYRLGVHDRIPRLLAHFEDHQEFYLAQEFIEGEPIAQELVEGQPWSQAKTLTFLQEVLQVLQFVHEQQVIHRDLKPSNLIRRRHDQKLVLIDFGAVKQVSNHSFDPDTGQTNLTISIGTQGYMPSEQLAGKPRFSSDVYAVGILGIQALTGLHPKYLDEDAAGEIDWHPLASHVHPALKEAIDQMVRYDFRTRYASASEALDALQSLPTSIAEDTVQPPSTAVPATIRQRASNGTPMKTAIAAKNGAGYSSASDQAEIRAPAPNSANIANSDNVDGFTLPDDESLATALWIPSESFNAESFNVEPFHTEPFNSEIKNGIHSGVSNSSVNSNGVNSSGVNNNISSNGTPTQTGATQLLGRLYSSNQTLNQTLNKTSSTSSSTSASSADWNKPRWRGQAWILLVAIAALGLSTALLQAQFPLAVTQWFARRPIPFAGTAKPSPSPSVLPKDPKQLAAVLVKQAIEMQNDQQYEKALQLFDRAIAAEPSFADAYTGRCGVLNLLQRPEEAIVSCNDALAYNPDDPIALWGKGNALMLQNRNYEALKLYEDVTYLKPDFAAGWTRRGVALQNLGRSAEALNALERGIELERNSAEAWLAKGAALLNLQRYNDAIAALDKALQLQPDSDRARELRQQARDRAGK